MKNVLCTLLIILSMQYSRMYCTFCTYDFLRYCTYDDIALTRRNDILHHFEFRFLLTNSYEIEDKKMMSYVHIGFSWSVQYSRVYGTYDYIALTRRIVM